MITDNEKAKIRAVGEAVHVVTERLVSDLGGDPSDVALQAQAAGAQLATLDAMFAIREGTEWRGISDPKEIARQLLRDSGIGES